MTYADELHQTLSRVDIAPLLAFVRGCAGTLWVAGNGGSAATAQHWACDLSKAAGRRVQALGCNTAVLTAWANDRNYEEGLAQELFMLARSDDALICLSCSGTSINIYYALREARAKKIPCALITSRLYTHSIDEPRVEPDVLISVPNADYGIIEDCHSAIGHWLTKELTDG